MWRFGWSAVSGALLVLSFPNFIVPRFPVLAGWIAWFALVPLLLAFEGARPMRALACGWTAGFISFLGGIHWMSHSMIHFGGMGRPEAYAIVLALAAYLALYPALFAALSRLIAVRQPLGAALAAATLWTAAEWGRSHALSGFGWLSLGYSQYLDLPMTRFSALGGVASISFTVVFVAKTLAGAFSAVREQSQSAPAHTRLLGITVAGVAALHLAGYLAPVPAGAEFKVAVVQPNVSQDQKWDPALSQEILRRMLALTGEAQRAAPDLIIWPEASFPFHMNEDPAMSAPVFEFVKKTGTPLLVGSDEEVSGEFYNAAFLMTRDRPESAESAYPSGGVWLQRYRKVHLVPLGEYIPWWVRSFIPGAQQIAEHAGVGGFSAGTSRGVLRTPKAALGVLICYESVFPDEVAEFGRAGAQVLVNITNDAWFGNTAGPYQHAAVLALRAAENRLPLARSANTGVSGFYDATGRMTQATELETAAVRVETLHLGAGPVSIFSSGEAVGVFCALISVLLVAGGFLRRRR